MKNSILNLGKALNKAEQKLVNGGGASGVNHGSTNCKPCYTKSIEEGCYSRGSCVAIGIECNPPH